MTYNDDTGNWMDDKTAQDALSEIACSGIGCASFWHVPECGAGPSSLSGYLGQL